MLLTGFLLNTAGVLLTVGWVYLFAPLIFGIQLGVIPDWAK
jgi:hypothetical protein